MICLELLLREIMEDFDSQSLYTVKYILNYKKKSLRINREFYGTIAQTTDDVEKNVFRGPKQGYSNRNALLSIRK